MIATLYVHQMKEKVRHGGLGGWRDKASPSCCPCVTAKLAPGLEGPLRLILGSGAYSNGDFDGI